MPSWRQWKQLPRVLKPGERRLIKIAATLSVLSFLFIGGWYVLTHRSEVPTAGGEYTEGLVGTPQLINPLYASASDVDSDIARLVYSGLLKWDQNEGLVPDLADTMEISEDQTTYTFHIRDNAKWHNNDDVRASDIVFTINSLQNAAYRSPLAAGFAGVSISELDNKTVQFVLDEPFAPFLQTLTVGILPARLWQQVPAKNAALTSLNLEPVGSGPYQFGKFSIDKNGNIKSYTLTRNKNYYAEPPKIETLTFKFYTDAKAAVSALENRNVEGVSFVPTDLVSEVEKNKNVAILRPSIPRTVALFFNEENQPLLEDANIKNALRLLINKQAVLDAALDGYGDVIHAPILEGNIGYHPELEIVSEDRSKAAELLDETDYVFEGGSEFRSIPDDSDEAEAGEEGEEGEEARKNLTLTMTTVDQAEFISAAEMIAEQAKAGGIEIKLNVVPSENFYNDAIKNRNFEILLTATQLGIDPDPYPFWHSSQINEPGLNLAKYANRNVDTLLEEARQTTDESVRAEKYKEFQEILQKDLPAIFLYQSTYSYAISTKIHNVSIERLFVPADRFGGISDWYIKTKKVLQ